MEENIVSIEEFSIDGEMLEAKIIQKNNSYLSGKYEIIVKKKNVGDWFEFIAKLNPAIVFVNNQEMAHRFLSVDNDYRRKGIASWMFNRLKKLGDILDTECVSENSLKEFYLSEGYEIVSKIRCEINKKDYFFLKLKD